MARTAVGDDDREGPWVPTSFAARQVGLPLRRLYEWLDAGLIAPRKKGRTVLVCLSEVERVAEVQASPVSPLSSSQFTLERAHTAEVPADALMECRRLMDEAFNKIDERKVGADQSRPSFTDEDWDHGLGGIHAIARFDGRVIGHGAIVQRSLLVGEVPKRCGYVELVCVHPAWQRRGVGGRVMSELERIALRAYDIAALASTEIGIDFYQRRGWVPWKGNLYAMTPQGRQRTPDEDGGIYVFPNTAVPLDRTADLTCDYRPGDLW